MRYSLVALFILLSAVMTQAQTGPCTESVIKEGHLPVADDAFSYMPPYGKPVVGRPAMQDANKKSFPRPYQHQKLLGRRTSDCVRAIRRHGLRIRYGSRLL